MKRTLSILISLIFIVGCSNKEEAENTNDIYLIPNGFEGSILVLYDVPDQPPLKKEGNYTVIPIKRENLEGLEATNIQQYGIYLTSTEDLKYGTVNNQYYYIDEKGNRTAIDEQCTHLMGNGSFTGGSGKEIKYQSIQITKGDCGETFYLNGKDDYYTQIKEVKGYWMNYLD